MIGMGFSRFPINLTWHFAEQKNPKHVYAYFDDDGFLMSCLGIQWFVRL
jgi:hypothetical protein